MARVIENVEQLGIPPHTTTILWWASVFSREDPRLPIQWISKHLLQHDLVRPRIPEIVEIFHLDPHAVKYLEQTLLAYDLPPLLLEAI
ncbi:hypothetical protein ASF71_17945 [Deinococcus sp. Leaf326]|nr:hypothetical protein ASF71_17945 [Deinococcus sp. Leaf326]